MIKCYLTEQIVADLKEKIVLLSGQRQVGKTTFILKTLKGKPVEYCHFFLCR